MLNFRIRRCYGNATCYYVGTKIYKNLVSGIPEIYTMKIRSSRRFLMILSPALAVNNWCTYALYVAIEAMLNLHSKIICVVLQVC